MRKLLFQFSPDQCRSPAGHGWQTAHGGPISDGSWHLYEFHMRIESSTGAGDGIAQMWVDGVQAVDCTGQTFGGQFNSILIGSNNLWPDVSRCMAVDIDDLAIRTTGPIGPVGPGDTLAPAAPSNLTVQ